MNVFLANSSIPYPSDVSPGQNGTGNNSKFAPSGLVNTRISYLKILALSLLREIASAETGETSCSSTIDLQAEVRRFETELIRSALIQTGGRQRQAARLLGTKVTTLNTKIKRYKIDISD